MNTLRKSTTNFDSLMREFDHIFHLFNEKSNGHNPEEFFTELPLPGLSKDDVTIELKDNTLIIKTELDNPIGFMRRYKGGYYSYYLSDYHDLTNIEAKMENGLLSITVPLKKEKKKDAIKVTVK
jgi:HSP20 family molecular chaperone IbpA